MGPVSSFVDSNGRPKSLLLTQDANGNYFVPTTTTGSGGGGGGGGGTQYVEGTVVANATGNAFLIKDASGAERQVSSSNPLFTYDQDLISPVVGNITAADVASTTVSGNNGSPIIQGGPTANSFVSVAFSAENSVSVLTLGDFVGTLSFEKSIDNGSTWTLAGMSNNGSVVSTLTSTISGSINGTMHINGAGTTNFRVRATARTSGTATVKVMPGAGVFPLSVITPILGQYNATAPTFTGGSVPMQVDANGNQKQYQATQMDQINDSVSTWEKGLTKTPISASGVVVTGACVYYGYTVESSTSGTAIFYDNTAASGGTVGSAAAVTLTAGTNTILTKGINMSNGVYVAIGGTATINVLTRSVSK